jgi:hypothetical protein
MRPLPTVLLLAAAAGCLTPAQPQGLQPGGAWTEWGGAWVSQGDGCGMCEGPSAQGAEMFLTAIDREGKVLRVDYAIGGDRDVTFMDPALERWRPVATPLFAAHDQPGQEWEEGRVRVFAVHALQLAPADAARVHEALAEAVAKVRPLPPANLTGCSDCSAPVLHAGGLRAELDRHVPADSGWPDLERQMAVLRPWVAGETLPIEG